MVALLLVLGRLLLPRLFAQAARTKSPELFMAASLLVVIVAALATGAVGLSPLMGALLAGLLIAETDYHTEVEAFTAPFKGLALGVFLLTVGMSIDLRVVWDSLWTVLAATLAVLVLKAVVTAFALRLMGARAGTATEAGILLASPSETTLIVLAAASAAALIQPGTAQFWQIVTALGLTVTPILAWLGRRVGRSVDQEAARRQSDDELDPADSRAIIVGCGRVGRLVADMLETHGKPYLMIDADADQVRDATRRGHNARFGDAARSGTLSRLGVEQASAVILTMDEPVGAQRWCASCANNTQSCRSSPAPATSATPPRCTAPARRMPCLKRSNHRCSCPKRCWLTWACRWGRSSPASTKNVTSSGQGS